VLDATAQLSQDAVDKTFDEMVDAAVLDLKVQGIEKDDASITKAVDMCYKGQSFDLTIPYSGSLEKAIAAFHKAHAKAYTYCLKDRPTEVVNLRLSAVHRLPNPPSPRFEGKGDPRPYGHRTTLFDGKAQAALHKWEDLRPGHKGKGPSVIEEKGFTAYVPNGFSWSMDRHGNILMVGGGPK